MFHRGMFSVGVCFSWCELSLEPESDVLTRRCERVQSEEKGDRLARRREVRDQVGRELAETRIKMKELKAQWKLDADRQAMEEKLRQDQVSRTDSNSEHTHTHPLGERYVQRLVLLSI